jgi:hypothetical protein
MVFSCLVSSCIALDATAPTTPPLTAFFSFTSPSDDNPVLTNAPWTSSHSATHDGHTPVTIYVEFSAPVSITEENVWIFDKLHLRPTVSFSTMDAASTRYQFSFDPVPYNRYNFQFFGVVSQDEAHANLDGQRNVFVWYTGGDL